MKKRKYLLYSLLYIVLVILVLYKPNYIIYKPGGIEDVSKSYKIKDSQELEGSINITYVATVKPNLIYYFYAKLKDYDIEKMSDYAPNGLDKEEKVDTLLYISSVDNAIYNAYKYAGKEIIIKDEKVYVEYSLNDDSELEEGDLILEINNTKITCQDDIRQILNATDDDSVLVKFQRNEKDYTTEVKLIKEERGNFLGIQVIDIFDYDTNPKIDFSIKDDVAGPSGGAMFTLSVYASLMDYDITHGLKIAGTGSIDRDGKIGPIGSIDYKIKSALKEDVDVFFVPKYYNYSEVLDMDLDLKDMKVIPVENFEDILDYLANNK